MPLSSVTVNIHATGKQIRWLIGLVSGALLSQLNTSAPPSLLFTTELSPQVLLVTLNEETVFPA